jgi:hypothetical protein
MESHSIHGNGAATLVSELATGRFIPQICAAKFSCEEQP